MDQPLLFFDCVSMCYHDDSGETEVLSDFTLRVDSGEFLALLGPSGCGKSTVLSLAAGLLKPDSGRVTLRGQEIRRPPLHMGYMLQRDHLFPWLTVRENALLGIRVRQKEPSARQKRHVEDLLAACGLTEFADALPGQLSGGMLQRAAAALLMALHPKYILADEPTSALDAENRTLLLELLGKQRETAGILFISHDIAALRALCGTVYVMEHGMLTEQGTMQELLEHPKQAWTKEYAAANRPASREGWTWTD